MSTRHDNEPTGEQAYLRRLMQLLGAQSGRSWTDPENSVNITLAIGANAQDDCAVLDVDDASIVIGSDFIRGSQFFLHQIGRLCNYDIGWYLAGANLSDVAAMGATPVALLSVVRYPKELNLDDFDAIVTGIRDSCAQSGALNVGGDIGTSDRLVLSASALGIVGRGRALLRSGAQPGDAVFLTGHTGLAGAALRYFRNSGQTLAPKLEEDLLRPWRRVRPRVREGQTLARAQGVNACIDTSDGLKGAVEAIAAASNVGITIFEESVPVPALVREVASIVGVDHLEITFGDSVDFQLLFVIREHHVDEVLLALEREGCAATRIGEVTSGAGARLRRITGQTDELPGSGWNHTS